MSHQQATVLIAPSHIHDQLRIMLAQNNQQLSSVTIITLSAFLKRELSGEIDAVDVILKYRDALRSYPAKLYQNILLSLDFLEQCHQFIEAMKLYHISVDELPTENAAQKELKQILSLLISIPTAQDYENQAWEKLSHQDLSHVQIISLISSADDEIRINRLKKLGATSYPIPAYQPKAHYIHALNKRKECEYIAQWIIQEHLSAQDIQITMCDESYALLFQQVFERYRIPFTLLKQALPSIVAQKAQALLQYLLKPDMQSIIELLQTNAISAPYQKEFIDYVKLFGKQSADSFDHIQMKGKVSQLISETELAQLQRLEQRARQCKSAIAVILERLHKAKQPQDILTCISDIISENIAKTDVDQLLMLTKLNELFVAFLPYFHELQDIGFLIQLLSKQQEQKHEKNYHGVLITTLKQPLYPGKIGVLAGATQKKYPAFPKLDGFFDEAYAALIASYPTLTARHRQYMQDLEAYLFSYPQLTVTYPIGGYDGKANESALELEQLLQQKSILKEPYHRYIKKENRFEISAESARRLYLKQDKLYGSISSFEKYMRCPFAYFLTYGLKLKQPIDYEFSQSRIGTLSHYILETLVSRYQKEYSKASDTEINQLISEQLQAISDIYPLLSDRLEGLKKRLSEAMRSNLETLNDMEAHSSLSPFACEHEFWWDMGLGKQQLCLHGFIDRIDANQDFMRIIDYKSSKKTMSETDFCAGLQLQLCAYALYAYEKWGKRMLGAFYYSLKKENINGEAGKLKRRPVAYIPMDKADFRRLQKNERRLRGWVMNEAIEAMDDDGTHIQGVRCNKDSELKASRLYDIEELKEMMIHLFTHITDKILSGDIACEPSNDACTFCPYHDICRFHGYVKIKEPIVGFEKEKAHADME